MNGPQAIADRLPEDLEYYEQGIGSVVLADLDDGDGGLLTPCGCVGVQLHAILEPEGWWTGWGYVLRLGKWGHAVR